MAYQRLKGELKHQLKTINVDTSLFDILKNDAILGGMYLFACCAYNGYNCTTESLGQKQWGQFSQGDKFTTLFQMIMKFVAQIGLKQRIAKFQYS